MRAPKGDPDATPLGYKGHGSGMRGAKQEAISVGADHLQLWLEHILLSILGYSRKKSAQDWLSDHVRSQLSDLARLQAAVRT